VAILRLLWRRIVVEVTSAIVLAAAQQHALAADVLLALPSSRRYD
jgi:hypothetical protein